MVPLLRKLALRSFPVVNPKLVFKRWPPGGRRVKCHTVAFEFEFERNSKGMIKHIGLQINWLKVNISEPPLVQALKTLSFF